MTVRGACGSLWSRVLRESMRAGTCRACGDAQPAKMGSGRPGLPQTRDGAPALCLGIWARNESALTWPKVPYLAPRSKRPVPRPKLTPALKRLEEPHRCPEF